MAITMSLPSLGSIKSVKVKDSTVVGGDLMDNPNATSDPRTQRIYDPTTAVTLGQVKAAGGMLSTAKETAEILLAKNKAEIAQSAMQQKLKRQIGLQRGVGTQSQGSGQQVSVGQGIILG